MYYNYAQDIKSIRELLSLSQTDFAKEIDVQQVTISRSETGKTQPSAELLEKVYTYAFSKNIRLNRLKEMLHRESLQSGRTFLFHAAKGEISGEIDAKRSRTNNDMGQGFYTGENYDQAVSFVSGFGGASIYMLDFDPAGLKCKEYSVDRDWMLTIAFFRGTLERYEGHELIKKLAREAQDCDYIIAPIADNRMFQIINSFITGEITDEQCKHCLAATNLGRQFVFKTERATQKLRILERCYIPANESEYYATVRSEEAKLGEDKVRLARINYRGQGKYVDEILA